MPILDIIGSGVLGRRGSNFRFLHWLRTCARVWLWGLEFGLSLQWRRLGTYIST